MNRTRTLIIALVVAVLLQASVIPYLAIGIIRPNVPVLVLAFTAARRGPYFGVIAGFLVGLGVDLLSTGFLGLSSFSFSIVGFLIGKVFYSDVPMSVGRWAVASGVATVVWAILFMYIYTLGTQAGLLAVLMRQAVPTALYTWVIGMFWAISPLYERRGGVRLD
ncbi:rod shape-determining protein MreD [bacterium]|nr:rod shape-determining protein MreD [bacterium]